MDVDGKKTRYICIIYDEWLEEMFKRFGVAFKIIEILDLEE